MEITYEQFAEMDVRIGTILDAERIADADRLLRLSIDLGEGAPRTIVSGISIHFPNPSDLVGKQVPVLTNIKPRVIRGIESHGMILAASNGEDLALLHPHKALPTGSVVK
jgi:methionyl-tRNA synthetase